jgi:hypothetical protein
MLFYLFILRRRWQWHWLLFFCCEKDDDNTIPMLSCRSTERKMMSNK